MDNLLTVAFEAHNAAKNHHRHYALTVGRDLLDDWTVAICYGRSGQPGRELRYAAAEADAMRAIIRDRLRRRLSAPKRIGCPYRLAVYSSAPGFDAAAWLPGEMMAAFDILDHSSASVSPVNSPGKCHHFAPLFLTLHAIASIGHQAGMRGTGERIGPVFRLARSVR